MPLNTSFIPIYKKFLKRYGEDDGKTRYYRWLNSRKLDDTISASSQKSKFRKNEEAYDDDNWADALYAEIEECFEANVEQLSLNNKYFRRVIYTGQESQLVLMSLKPGEDIGMEIHPDTDQILFFTAGTCEATLDGQISRVGKGEVVFVSAGTEHNFKNVGNEDVKLYTVYSPPEHSDGLVQMNKGDVSEIIQDFEKPSTYSFEQEGREKYTEKMKKSGYVEWENFENSDTKSGYFCDSCEYFEENPDSPTGMWCKKFKFPDKRFGCCDGWEIHPDLRTGEEMESEEITKDKTVSESINRSMNYWKLRNNVRKG